MSEDTSVLDNIVQEAQARPESLDPSKLGEVAQLANDQLLLELRQLELQQELKEVSKKLQDLSTQAIPEAMDELGLAELKLSDGTVLTLGNFYSCSIKDDAKASAMDWLKGHDHADVIKTEVLVPFQKGDVEAAEKFRQQLEKRYKSVHPSVVYSVHAQTLKKLAREVHEAGDSLPEDYFNLYIGRVSKLKKA